VSVPPKVRQMARECIAVRTRLLNRLVTGVCDAGLRPFGVRVAQVNILCAVANSGPITPTDLAAALVLDKSTLSRDMAKVLENGWVEKTTTFKFDYAYREIPSDVFLYLDSKYTQKLPFVSLVWKTPDGRSINLKAKSVSGNLSYDFESGFSVAQLLNQNPAWKKWFIVDGQYPTPAYQLLFAKPGSTQPAPLNGTYELEVKSLFFEPNANIRPKLVLLGQVYGVAGTDYWRRDLIVPLLWGAPIALAFGLIASLGTSVLTMVIAAVGTWYGGWVDELIQRITEINLVLPFLAILILIGTFYSRSIWVILGATIALSIFTGAIKGYRSIFVQVKESMYIEAARAYGASGPRIVFFYLIPRMIPLLIPGLVASVPAFVFLEASLAVLGLGDPVLPTWGKIIDDAQRNGALYRGYYYWILEPATLLMLTGLGFAMLGFALDRIFNPKLREV